MTALEFVYLYKYFNLPIVSTLKDIIPLYDEAIRTFLHKKGFKYLRNITFLDATDNIGKISVNSTDNIKYISLYRVFFTVIISHNVTVNIVLDIANDGVYIYRKSLIEKTDKIIKSKPTFALHSLTEFPTPSYIAGVLFLTTHSYITDVNRTLETADAMYPKEERAEEIVDLICKKEDRVTKIQREVDRYIRADIKNINKLKNQPEFTPFIKNWEHLDQKWGFFDTI